MSKSIKPLAIASYLIHDVVVSKNETGPRFAIATVSLFNISRQTLYGCLHQIGLKHCYNKYSKGPKTTAYDDLIGKVLTITEIVKPSFGDLDIVTWALVSYKTTPLSKEEQVVISRGEDDQLLWDVQAEALLLESEAVETPEEEDTDGYDPFEDDEPENSK
jgi:hypothetical protein